MSNITVPAGVIEERVPRPLTDEETERLKAEARERIAKKRQQLDKVLAKERAKVTEKDLDVLARKLNAKLHRGDRPDPNKVVEEESKAIFNPMEVPIGTLGTPTFMTTGRDQQRFDGKRKNKGGKKEKKA